MHSIQTIRLSIIIQAGKRTVWNALLQQFYSRQRLSELYNTTVDEGSYILKEIPAGNEVKSRVVRCSLLAIISLQHELIVESDPADLWHPDIKNWIGLYEIYRLIEKDRHTVLQIEADSPGRHAIWHLEMIKTTLNEIKMRSEQMNTSISAVKLSS